MSTSVPKYWRRISTYYRLVAKRCSNCGRTLFPPRPVCPYCRSSKLDEVELSKDGVLEEFTIIRTAPSGFEYYTPYVIGVVRLSDGTRVLAQLVDVDLSKLKPGLPVEAVFRKVREDGEYGIIMYSMKFRARGD